MMTLNDQQIDGNSTRRRKWQSTNEAYTHRVINGLEEEESL